MDIDSTPSGSNAAASTSGAQANALSAIDEEEEEASGRQPTAGPSSSTVASTTTNKKRTASSVVASDDEDVAPSNKRVAVAKVPVAPTPAPVVSEKTAPKPKKGAAANKTKKGEAAKAPADEGILQIKSTKRKGAERDQAFNDDFNALKIARPTFQKMQPPKTVQIGWNDVDPEEERNRLIREDGERQDNPETWGDHGQKKGYFIIERIPMRRKENPVSVVNPELPEKWKGMKNFKKFRVRFASRPCPAL